jgi:hypothetical protein
MFALEEPQDLYVDEQLSYLFEVCTMSDSRWYIKGR